MKIKCLFFYVKMNIFVKKENNEYIYSLNETENCTLCTYVGTGHLKSYSQCYIVVYNDKIEPYCFTNKKTAKSTCKKGTIETVKKVSLENTNEICIICTETCEQSLSCGHFIHTSCVAKSGKPECSVCKKEVKLEENLTLLCEQKNKERKEELKKQEEEESEILARQLASENQQKRTTIRIHNYTCNVILQNEIEWTGDSFTMEIYRVLHEIHLKKQNITTYNSVIQTIPLVYKINSIAFSTNLSVNDICNSLSLVANN
jgi:hypothetical protein